jgi:hypothetical protein
MQTQNYSKKKDCHDNLHFLGPGFGQAQKCGGVKPVNATLPL